MNLFKFASLHNKKLAFIIFGISCVVASGCGFEVAAAPDLSVSSGSSEWVKNVKSLLEEHKGSLHDYNSAGSSSTARDLGGSSYKGSLYDISSDTYGSFYDEPVGDGSLFNNLSTEPGDYSSTFEEDVLNQPVNISSFKKDEIQRICDYEEEPEVGVNNEASRQLSVSDVSELERKESKVASTIIKKVLKFTGFFADDVTDDELGKFVKWNWNSVISVFLKDLKNLGFSEANSALIAYVSDLQKWRNGAGSGVAELSPVQFDVMFRECFDGIDKVAQDNFGFDLKTTTEEEKWKRLLPNFLNLVNNLKNEASSWYSKSENLQLQQMVNLCDKFDTANKRWKRSFTAGGFHEMFAYGVLKDYMKKVFVKMGVNVSKVFAGVAYSAVRKTETRLEKFSELVHKFAATEEGKAGLKIKELNGVFAAWQPAMAAYISVVNTLLTPVRDIDMSLVDPKSSFAKFISGLKEHNLDKGIYDDRTFLDFALLFYLYAAGRGVDSGKAYFANAKAQIIDAFFKNSTNAVYGELTGAVALPLALQPFPARDAGYDGGKSIFEYFKMFDKFDSNITYTGDIVPRASGFGSNFTGAAGQPAPHKLESIVFNLAKALFANKQGYAANENNIAAEVENICDDILELKAEEFNPATAVVANDDFIKAIKESKLFFARLVKTMAKFDISKAAYADSYAPFAAEVVKFVNNHLTMKELKFLAVLPDEAASSLLKFDSGTYASTGNNVTFKSRKNATAIAAAWIKDDAIIDKGADNADLKINNGERVTAFVDAVTELRKLLAPFFSGKIDADFLDRVLKSELGALVKLNDQNALVVQHTEIGEQFDSATLGTLANGYSTIDASLVDSAQPEAEQLMNLDFDVNNSFSVFNNYEYAGIGDAEKSNMLLYLAYSSLFNDMIGEKRNFKITKTKGVDVPDSFNLKVGDKVNFLNIIGSYNGAPISFSNMNSLDDDMFLQAMAALGQKKDGRVETIENLRKIYDSAKDVKINILNVDSGESKNLTVSDFYNYTGRGFKDHEPDSIAFGAATGKDLVINDVVDEVYLKNRHEERLKETEEDYKEKRERLSSIMKEFQALKIKKDQEKIGKKNKNLEKQKKKIRIWNRNMKKLMATIKELNESLEVLHEQNKFLHKQLDMLCAAQNTNLKELEREVVANGGSTGVINLIDPYSDGVFDVENLKFDYKESNSNSNKAPSYTINLDEETLNPSNLMGAPVLKGPESSNKVANRIGGGLVSPKAAEAINRGYF